MGKFVGMGNDLFIFYKVENNIVHEDTFQAIEVVWTFEASPSAVITDSVFLLFQPLRKVQKFKNQTSQSPYSGRICRTHAHRHDHVHQSVDMVKH